MPSGNINTVPLNVNIYLQWILQPCRYNYTLSGNRNTESVKTHIIGIHPVAISEQLLVRLQLIKAETVDTVTLIIFTKI